MRLLYRGGAWLPSADAAAISRHGLQHLRSVYKCAQLSLAMRQPRFPIHSKMHMLHHTFQFLVPWLYRLGFPLPRMHELHFVWWPLPIWTEAEFSEKVRWVENPLVDSTQLDEAFIGVVARISRRVAPMATVHRTYDVYLTVLQQQLQKSVMDHDAEEVVVWGKSFQFGTGTRIPH